MNAAHLRDEVEQLLCAWNAYELSIGASPVVDYDCRPVRDKAETVPGRVYTYRELKRVEEAAISAGRDELARRIDCHLAYLEALLGTRRPLGEYVRRTQGCGSEGWSPEYVSRRGEEARKAVEARGISWGPETWLDLQRSEEKLAPEQVADAIREAARLCEPSVRALTGTDAAYTLAIETDNVDAYWEYWLDGVGQNARLRLNMRNARFTDVQARQFALHEVLGHALQSASYSARCVREEVPWVRILSVHAEHQVMLEGLAQALPFFVASDDEALMARVKLDYYLQLAYAELHLAVNNGVNVLDCVRRAKSRTPFWTDERIGRAISDRSNDPILRSYHWAYPAGADWFVSLAESGDPEAVRTVLSAAYRDPLTPADLMRLWPSGPPIGGEA